MRVWRIGAYCTSTWFYVGVERDKIPAHGIGSVGVWWHRTKVQTRKCRCNKLRCQCLRRRELAVLWQRERTARGDRDRYAAYAAVPNQVQVPLSLAMCQSGGHGFVSLFLQLSLKKSLLSRPRDHNRDHNRVGVKGLLIPTAGFRGKDTPGGRGRRRRSNRSKHTNSLAIAT